MADGRMEIRHPFRGTMEVELDADGRIRTLDAANTTRKLTVERVDDLDVDGPRPGLRAAGRQGAGIGALSGRGEAVGEIGGADVAVDYGVPREAGPGHLRRAGPLRRGVADGREPGHAPDHDRDLVIGGARGPGRQLHPLHHPGPREWTLIINSATDITGTAHDPATDFARVTMGSGRWTETVEAFTIEVDEDGYLRMQWDRTEAYVPVRAAP
jgi:hypothetical protein